MSYKTDLIESKVIDIQKNHKERPVMLAPLIHEINEKKLYKDAGYDNFYSYCKDRFSIGETQVKIYNKVGKFYGTLQYDGSYIIDEAYFDFGIEKLYEITKLSDFDFDNPLNTISSYGISPEMTKSEIEKIVLKARNKDISEELYGIDKICSQLNTINGALKMIQIWGNNESISDERFKELTMSQINALLHM